MLGFVLFGRFRPLPQAELPLPARRVRVVIPARNEAHALGPLLDDLDAQVAAGDVVVADDNSEDSTRDVAAERAGVRVVAALPPPEGWCGKPWACHVGVESLDDLVDDDLLLFVDADVRFAPGSVDALVATSEELGGVVSVQPHHVVPTAVEQLSGMFNVVSVMGVAAGTTAPSGLFGPVICCRPADYRRIGGHAAVRDEVIEDIALAERFLEHGVALRTFSGGERIRFRMYPLGFGSLVEGWTKNIAGGARRAPLVRTVATAVWVTAVASAAVAVVREPDLGSGVGYSITAFGLGVLLRRVGTYRWWAAVAFPVLVGCFVAIFARSAVLTVLRRRVRWKGRSIPARGSTAWNSD